MRRKKTDYKGWLLLSLNPAAIRNSTYRELPFFLGHRRDADFHPTKKWALSIFRFFGSINPQLEKEQP
jgi:hypothetical protein